MALKFRKRIKIVPGVNLNLSKSGISTSIGKPGATVNIGKKGVKTTVGLPGTGLSWSNSSSYKEQGMDSNERQGFWSSLCNIVDGIIFLVKSIVMLIISGVALWVLFKLVASIFFS
jgi:hypothetical protein